MWNEKTRLAIIADDLTGSCDTACQFARFNLAPFVTHSPLTEQTARIDEILVVNSDSRKQSASGAQKTILQICSDLRAYGRRVFYKKIDSTLKGNWAAEVAAIVKARCPDLVLLAPAFPEWGRTTVGGIQLLDGVPVSETKLARRTPERSAGAAHSADISVALQMHFGKKVFLVNRATVRKGPARIEQEVRLARSRGFYLIVFDAVGDEDLHNIALGGCRLEGMPLWVGSGGLARFLPLGWGCVPVEPRWESVLAPLPSLLINGSLHPVNLQQLTVLTRGRNIYRVTLEDEDAPNSPVAQAKLSRATDSLRQGVDVALSLRLKRAVQSLSQLQQLHTGLQFLTGELINSGLVGGMVVVGGETATKIYRDLGACGITIRGEVQAGIPAGYWVGGRLNGRPIITKAGGFGRDDTLLRAMEFLRGESRAVE